MKEHYTINSIETHQRQVKPLPLRLLKCAQYQRPFDAGEVDEIVANFDTHLVNPPKVSYRDGQYWVFDGQHTVGALKRVYGDDTYMTMCQVFYGMTYEKEAYLFSQQAGAARSVKTINKLHALCEASDMKVRSFVTATENAGFKISLNMQKRTVGYLPAVVTAWECFKKLGAEEYTRMMTLIHRTWKGELWSVGQNMLIGVTLFIKVYGDSITDKRFISNLGKCIEVDIRKVGGQLSTDRKIGYAAGIAKLYNKRAGAGALNISLIGLYEEESA